MRSNSEVKSLVKLALPVAAAHIANMAMQVVDTLFVGRIGAEAIGGVSAGSAIYAVVMVLGIGIMLGVDYLVSHSFGAGKIEDCHRSLVQAVYLAVFFSIPCMVLMYFSGSWFAAFGIEPGVAAQGERYMRWLTWSLLPLLLFTAYRQYLQALGVAAPVMVIMVLANIVNAFANWLFIFGNWGMPKLEISGAGLATCIARVYMLVALVLYIYLRDRRLNLGLSKVSWQISRARMRELLRLGLPAALQLGLEVGVFAFVTLLAGRLSATALAAHQIVLHIASVMFMVPLGLSVAAAVRVGHALGQGSRHRAARIGWTALGLGAGFMCVSGVTLYLIKIPLLSAFTKDATVIATGGTLLLIAAFFQLFDGVQVVATGVLRGIGNTRASLMANLLGHWGLGLPVGALLCFRVGWGASGLWIGLCLGLIAVALMLLWVWARKAKSF